MRLLRLATIAALFVTLASSVRAQDTDEADPLKRTRTLGSSAEIVLFSPGTSDAASRQQQIYDYLNLNNPDPNVPNEITEQGGQVLVNAMADDDASAMAVVTGDFDGDGLGDVLSAWEGPGQSIEVSIPSLDRMNLGLTQMNRTTLVPSGGMAGERDPARVIRLAAADFDTDRANEFVLAYWRDDATLQIELYDTDDSLTPRQIGTFNEPAFELPSDPGASTSRERSSRFFDVQAGDFDGDGTDEIVAVGGRALDGDPSTTTWEAFARVYDVHPETFQFTQRADTTFYRKDNNATLRMDRVAAEAGRYGPEFAEGLALAFSLSNNSSQAFWRIVMSRVLLAAGEDGAPLDPTLWASAADTSRFELSPEGSTQFHQTSGSNGYALSLEAADLDRDGRDEAVLYHRQLHVFGATDDYAVDQRGNTSVAGSNRGSDARYALAIADLDADNDLANDSGDWTPELIVVGNSRVRDNGESDQDGVLRIQVYEVTENDFGGLNLTETVSEDVQRVESENARPVAVAAVDVGDNGIRVGTPTRYDKTDIVRPLIVLNAPPIHFDVFDGQNFDVGQCYGEQDCACKATLARCFQARYSTETERSVTVETELKTDWSTSITASGGFEIPKIEVGVKASITGTYGQGFRRNERNTQNFTVQQTIEATRDDWIYAMIVDYTIWEYPLFVDGEQSGHIAVVIPKLNTRAWFDSKSWNAFDYVPYHEVGNILSYRGITSPDENASLDRAVRWETGDQITLSGTSDAVWQLTSEGTSETAVENSVTMGINGEINFDIPFPIIPNVDVKGDYSQTDMTTRTVKVRDKQGIGVAFGNIDLGFGNTRYDVIPYTYWAKNGALVLDYAVNPELSQPGFEQTWWQEQYGQQSDPAFILPWRYDPEKGEGVSEAQTQQTRDILVDPAEPQVGDVVTIRARVHNWSLLPTPQPVAVQFFVGDPAAGGIPIVGTDGEASVSVPQLTDRGSAVAEMQWQVPDGVGAFPRIYAVIDPGEALDEIHETNNVGWTVLPIAATPLPTEAETEAPAGPRLFQNYPNPFSTHTTIAFEATRQERVTLQVFDMLGRRVRDLVDETVPPGRYTVPVPADDLASGVYLYRLTSGETVETRRMLVVR